MGILYNFLFMLFLYIKIYTINTMKYITYKNHSEYTQDDLRTLLDPSNEFKIVNLSEENNNVDLLYNAPRFTVLRQDNTTQQPVIVNDEQLKVFINKEFNNLSDYDTLPSEEYYIINNLYILKNSGYNKNKENMHDFRIKYPGYKPAYVDNFDKIESFVLTPQTDEFTCQIHMNWTNRENSDNGASDVDTHVFVYKNDEDGKLKLLNGGYGVYYSNKTFSNDDIEVVLSWDDTTTSNNRLGEYIKIKQKTECSNEEYAKYYFVYCLNNYSKQEHQSYNYTPNSPEHDSAVWNDVTISVTNGITYEVNTIEPQATTETANQCWCGLLIHNNNILSHVNKFASSLQGAISSTEFLVTITSPNRPSVPGMPSGGSASGMYSIILPEFTDELPEAPSKE